MSRKLIALVLAVVMVLSLAACNTGSGTTTTTTTKAPAGTTTSAAGTTTAAPATTTTEANPYAEHMDIVYQSNYMAGLAEDFQLKTELEEMFNVTFTLPDVDTNADWATFKLKITAGEIPDYMMLNTTAAQVYEWFDEEVIRAIPKDMVRTYAPNYTMYIDEDPAGWELYNVAGDDSQMMAMTGYVPAQNRSAFWVDYYNMTWLENVGVTVPGNVQPINENYTHAYYTDKAFTIDEQYDIFVKFRDNDPDGNGQNDTSAMVGYPALGSHGFAGITGAFGLSGTNNIEEDGVAKNYYATQNFKNLLSYMRKLYSEGLIDREFASLNFSTMNEKYLTGKYGYTSSAISYVGDTTGREEVTGLWGRAPLAMIVEYPEDQLVMTPLVTGATGTTNSAVYRTSPFGYQFMFGAEVSDEMMARILAIFDYSMFSKDGYTHFAYGIEGVHYTMEDDGFGGQKYVADPVMGASGKDGGRHVFAQAMFQPVDGRLDISKTAWSLSTDAISTSDAYMATVTGPYKYDLYNVTDQSAVSKEVGSAISTIVNEFWVGAVAGTIDLEAQWDSYLAQLKAAGYDKLEAAINDSPLYNDLFPHIDAPHK